MMKKQFNRMRQLANQTVGRAEKTEVLNEDLLQVEKRLELVKQVSHSTHKKLTACLQGQQGVDGDKRSKKLPLTTLAQCLVEGSTILGEDSLLGKMLKMCGDTEDRLAQELILFEQQIERDVIEPLFVLAEVDIPNIQKQRKHLAKLVLDMDSARTRWQQSSKSSGLSSNLQSSGAKADALREEMEEAANRVEICRDQLAADMYNFVAKEIDYANYFQTLIEVQAEYHKKSLVLLQSILPQIKAQQEAWIEKPSFGKPLEEHLAISGREIAFAVEACVTMLLECGMQEEGLFRVAASASKLKKLKASLDCGVLDVQEYSVDPHAVAGALKSYLRELPEPLMTFELYDEWIQASNIQDQDKQLQALWNACEKLPKTNYNNFRYLVKFLAKLTEYQDANKMTPGNMAIVLGPNLLWTANEGSMTEMMTTVSIQIVGIIEPIIQHADWFFPGDIEFNVTGSYGSPLHTNHNANYNSMPSPDIDHSDRKQHDQARRPLSVATDNMMLEFYKKDGTDEFSSNWSDSCYSYPCPEDDRPCPYPCLQHAHHFYHKAQSSAWPEVVPQASSPQRWLEYSPTLLTHPPSLQQLDINSNPKPCSLHLPKPGPSTDSHASETNVSPVYVKTPLLLTKHDPYSTPSNPSMSASTPWVGCGSGKDKGTRLTSAMKGKELSPVIGQKGRPVSDHVTSSSSLQQNIATGQLSSEQSPHTLRKGSDFLLSAAAKKVVSLPPKISFEQTASQPSPASLSPTPPSTPSPYAANYPQAYTLPPSQTPPAAPPLSSPPSQTSTLTKSRPVLKPRQRPTLPPPQPPTSGLTGSSPQPLDHSILDNLSAGESMSTDTGNPDPSFVQSGEVYDLLYTEPSDQMCTNSVADFIVRADSDEESESTVL
ncbi:rho GTPase-activating protein 44 isoform X4 [Amblyraja radiata]|uniref:rho GTPase-activating protein 44 isoform X4 n=1 Tax=Amblyraja radiata TaxID=386614 RepID=UPI001402573F|nr:rho GTPase-activating protein 44 isoform X4 [Amblyraja radiata]